MVGTWTPPGAIFTFEFDDESLSLNMIKRTEINQDEPISWMTFDVSFFIFRIRLLSQDGSVLRGYKNHRKWLTNLDSMQRKTSMEQP